MNAVELYKSRLRARLKDVRREDVEKAIRSRVIDFEPPYVARTAEDLARTEWSYAAVCKALITSDWSQAHVEKEMIRKALGPTTLSGGGVLIPLEQDTKVIDALRAKAIAYKLGVKRRPMKRQNLILPRLDSSTSAAWGYAGETRAESTNPTFGDVELVAKDLWVQILVERNLIMDSDPAVDSLIRDDGTKQMALKLDHGFFLGQGVAPEPLGVLYDPDVNVTTSVTAANVTPTVLLSMVTAVENDNGEGTGWGMSPQMWHTVRTLKDDNGKFIAGDGDITKGVRRTLFGYPIETSTQLKNAAGTSHYIFFGDFENQAVIGERKGVQIRVSEHRYIEINRIVIMLDGRFDCRLLQPKAFARLTVTSVTEV